MSREHHYKRLPDGRLVGCGGSILDRICDWAEKPYAGWVLGIGTIVFGSLAAVCLAGALP